MPDASKDISTPQIGDSYFAEVKPGGLVVEEYWDVNGTRRQFGRYLGEQVFEPESYVAKFLAVADFVEELQTSPVPLMIKTKSNLGEDIFLNARWTHPRNVDQDPEVVGGEIEDLLAITAFARGTGLVFPIGEFGLIAHRDLAFCRNAANEKFVFSDKKINADYYLPPIEAGWKIAPSSVERFQSGSLAIERYKPTGFGEPDPYAVGIGSLVQSVAVGEMLRRGCLNLKTNILLPDGDKIWRKFGREAGGGVAPINPETAIKAITTDIYSHIR